jgi:hypothetical protein
MPVDLLDFAIGVVFFAVWALIGDIVVHKP